MILPQAYLQMLLLTAPQRHSRQATHPTQWYPSHLRTMITLLLFLVHHAYYSIPLGQVSPGDEWHSAIQLTVTTVHAFRKRHTADMARVSVSKPLNNKDGQVDVWFVTLAIMWASSAYALALHPVFSDLFHKNYGGYIIEFNTYAGTLEVLQTLAPSGVSPAQLREAVIDTIQLVIQQDPPPSARSLQSLFLPAGTLPQPPEVEIRSAAFVPVGTTGC
jgi:hypothetical protein